MTEGLPALFLKRFKETEITSLVIVICCCAIANLSSLEDPVRFANFQGGPTWSMGPVACGLAVRKLPAQELSTDASLPSLVLHRETS